MKKLFLLTILILGVLVSPIFAYSQGNSLFNINYDLVTSNCNQVVNCELVFNLTYGGSAAPSTLIVPAGFLSHSNNWVKGQANLSGVSYEYRHEINSLRQIPTGTSYIEVGNNTGLSLSEDVFSIIITNSSGQTFIPKSSAYRFFVHPSIGWYTNNITITSFSSVPTSSFNWNNTAPTILSKDKEYQIRINGKFKTGANFSVDVIPALTLNSQNFNLHELAWWNTSFNYKKNITIITNGNAYTDMQVAVNVSFISGKMQNDFRELRFTYVNATDGIEYAIPHWKERQVNGSWVKLWVKIPTIRNNANETIYVYYGNTTHIPEGSNFSQTKQSTSTLGFQIVYAESSAQGLGAVVDENFIFVATDNQADTLLHKFWKNNGTFHSKIIASESRGAGLNIFNNGTGNFIVVSAAGTNQFFNPRTLAYEGGFNSTNNNNFPTCDLTRCWFAGTGSQLEGFYLANKSSATNFSGQQEIFGIDSYGNSILPAGRVASIVSGEEVNKYNATSMMNYTTDITGLSEAARIANSVVFLGWNTGDTTGGVVSFWRNGTEKTRVSTAGIRQGALASNESNIYVATIRYLNNTLVSNNITIYDDRLNILENTPINTIYNYTSQNSQSAGQSVWDNGQFYFANGGNITSVGANDIVVWRVDIFKFQSSPINSTANTEENQNAIPQINYTYFNITQVGRSVELYNLTLGIWDQDGDIESYDFQSTGTTNIFNNNSLIIDLAGISFPLNKVLNVSDDNKASAIKFINFTRSSEVYYQNETGLQNLTWQLVNLNTSFNVLNSTSGLNVSWHFAAPIGNLSSIEPVSGLNLNQISSLRNRSAWIGDWLNETILNWQQNLFATSEVNGTANITRNITIYNNNTQAINFTNVDLNLDNRSTWTGDGQVVTTSITRLDWSNVSYVINNSKSNVITGVRTLGLVNSSVIVGNTSWFIQNITITNSDTSVNWTNLKLNFTKFYNTSIYSNLSNSTINNVEVNQTVVYYQLNTTASPISQLTDSSMPTCPGAYTTQTTSCRKATTFSDRVEYSYIFYIDQRADEVKSLNVTFNVPTSSMTSFSSGTVDSVTVNNSIVGITHGLSGSNYQTNISSARNMGFGAWAVQIDYEVSTSVPASGGGGGGGVAIRNDGICNLESETEFNSPEDCAGNIKFDILPLRFSGPTIPGSSDLKDITLFNPNSEEITINATVVYSSEKDGKFCRNIGFSYSREVQDFPGGKVEWKVPPGSESKPGKTFGVLVVNIPESLPKERFTCSVIFSGPGLVSKAVPVEYTPDVKAEFLRTAYLTLPLGRFIVPIYGWMILLGMIIIVLIFVATRGKSGFRRRER